MIGGFPVEIVLRALTHVVFTTVGSLWIKKNPSLLSSWKKSTGLSAILALIHAACEVLVVLPFYFANPSKYTNGFFTAVILLVGIGSVVHSMVDFAISYVVWQPLKRASACRPYRAELDGKRLVRAERAVNTFGPRCTRMPNRSLPPPSRGNSGSAGR